jgi:predicted nucleotidyltransferase
MEQRPDSDVDFLVEVDPSGGMARPLSNPARWITVLTMAMYDFTIIA